MCGIFTYTFIDARYKDVKCLILSHIPAAMDVIMHICIALIDAGFAGVRDG